MQAIHARPDDDAPRLVYADWLGDHGDPLGELITVQCAMAKRGGSRSSTSCRRPTGKIQRYKLR